MKKLLWVLFLLTATVAAYSSTWIPITRQTPSPAVIRVMSPSVEHPVVRITIPGFSLEEVQTPQGSAYIVNVGRGTPLQEAGAPDLPKFTSTFVIPDEAEMQVRVTASQYQDFPDLLIAPSKGVITRDIDPAQVPYQYGQAYTQDQYFPAGQAAVRDPFIFRDLRGQTIILSPFCYNPVTKTLRVYYDLTVELYKISDKGLNPLRRTAPGIRIHPEWQDIYSREFDNFDAVTYTPLNDYGRLLVISHSSFMTAMQPYVDWKNESGIPTEMVDVSTIGSTAAAIKDYIANYYNNNGLTFVLLVGDGPQIPTNQYSGLGGPSDNAYGYISGSDHYPELFVGRFSAETLDQVQTQVQRTLNYEKNPQLLTNDWYTSVIGIASAQGPGDDGEYDYQHIRGLQAECLGYTYTWNPELFDGSQGGNDAAGNPTPATVSTAINEGAGLILYTGHGSDTSWGTSGFGNYYINNLTNQDKLPVIYSVACVNGNFLNLTCFAEAWLRATKNGQPTGAVAFLGSTINQSWNSPMDGQDEMVSILTESNPTNIRHTFAGIGINGCMKMIDSYGTDGANMADTWTVFGDPSLMIRTANPVSMTVTNPPSLFIGTSSFTVGCNVDGARATASINHQIIATGTVSGGSVTLTFAPLLNPADTVLLILTAYNHLPYSSTILLVPPPGPYVIYLNNSLNDNSGNGNGLVDYNEDILLTVEVKNVGLASTTTTDVILRSVDPYVQFTDSTENYGALEAGEVKSVPDAYFFHLSSLVPDGHAIPFQVRCVDDTSVWVSGFSLLAHAPVLNMLSCSVEDPLGNNNGRLDPGEQATLKIFVQNGGSAGAFNVGGHLVAISPWVTVSSGTQDFGDLAAGQNNFALYNVTVDPSAPEGQAAPFMLELQADQGIYTSAPFSLVIGKTPVLIVDFDGNTNSGTAMKTAADGLGVIADYVTAIPASLEPYQSAFVCLGTYPDNHILNDADGQFLKDFLNAGGRLYMEGADTWFYDPATPVHPMFFIQGLEDGGGDLGQIQGYNGTFTAGMQFSYAGDNSYVDHINKKGNAFELFKNLSPAYVNAVALDSTLYKTIGSCFEFGGLTDAALPSTKMNLLEEYLTFFGISIPSLQANFAGYPNPVWAGGQVQFTDFSSGGITSWDWSFPGGIPSTSTERNPIVTYPVEGTYDVELIISNGLTSDTLLKQAYMQVGYPVSTGDRNDNLAATVYPNPSQGAFSVSIHGAKPGRVTMRILNTLGNTVWQSEETMPANGFVTPVTLSVPNGIYFLNIVGSSGSLTKRVVINR